MLFIGRVQWEKGSVDLDRDVQVGRLCSVDQSVGESRSSGPDAAAAGTSVET